MKKNKLAGLITNSPHRYFNVMIILSILFLLFAFTSCDSQKARKESKEIDIIYTANLQGAILDLPCNNPVGKVEFYTIPRVMAKVQEMMKKSEKEGVPVIAVDGGNTLFGIDDLSRYRNGEPAFYLLKSAGVSAVAMGEAELIEGGVYYREGRRGHGEEKEGRETGRQVEEGNAGGTPAIPGEGKKGEDLNRGGRQGRGEGKEGKETGRLDRTTAGPGIGEDINEKVDKPGNEGPLPLASSGVVAKPGGSENFGIIVFAGNLVPKENSQPLKDGSPESDAFQNIPPSFTKEIDGVKVSFHSYFEPEESVMLPGVPEIYLHADFNKSMEKFNKKLESDDADYKVVIARVNNIEKFANAIKGVDLIIPGRFHHQLPSDKVSTINNIKIAPFVNSRYMGAARIRLQKKAKGNVEVSFTVEKPGEAKMPANADLNPYLDKFYKRYSKEYPKVHTAFIGYGDDRLKHTTGRPQETPTAFVIADMIRNYAGTDIALINLFSIRRQLAGIIRGEDVEWISPFGNKLVTIDLTGEQVREIMKLNLRRDTKFMIISGGSIKYNKNNTITLYIDGYPLDPKKTYRVATNDYLADSDKMEYRVFKLGKKVNKTEIPINGIFLEAVMKRRFIGMPPERVGIKSRAEIKKIKDPEEAAYEANKWGYFKLAYDKYILCIKKSIKANRLYFDDDPVYEIFINELDGNKIYKSIQAMLLLHVGLQGSSIEKSLEVIGNYNERIHRDDFLIYSYSFIRALKPCISIFYSFGNYEKIVLFADRSDLKDEKYINIIVGDAFYKLAQIEKSQTYLKKVSAKHPSDIRLRRLTEAVQSAQQALSGKPETTTVKPPIWAMFKGDPRNTGRSPYIGPAAKKVKVAWKFQTFHSNKSSPAVANDGTIYVAGGDGIFYALSPNGKLKWKYTLGGFLLSSPAIDNEGTVYVGTGSTERGSRRQTFRQGQADEKVEKSGSLCAFNPDGTLKWRFKTGGWAASSPLITSEGNIVFGCNDGFIYCVKNDGSLLWKFKTGDKVFSSPAEDRKGNIYAGSEDFYFYSLDKSGKLRWKHKAENKFFSSPAISDKGLIYTGNDDGHLYVFNPDGSIAWKKKFPEAITSTPSMGRDGDIYVGCENGVLYRMTSKGEIKWEFRREDEFFSSPIIDKKGNIYIGNEDNFLYCVSPGGEVLWKFETGDYIESTPVISSDGKVYLCAEDKFFYVLEED